MEIHENHLKSNLTEAYLDCITEGIERWNDIRCPSNDLLTPYFVGSDIYSRCKHVRLEWVGNINLNLIARNQPRYRYQYVLDTTPYGDHVMNSLRAIPRPI